MTGVHILSPLSASAPLPVPAGEALSAALAVEVVDDLAGLERLAAEWEALEAASGPGVLFQTHAQIVIWARHFTGGDSGTRLHVVVVRDAGRARLIVPLGISRRAGLRIGRIAGDPVAQYAEVLVDPAADLPACFAAALSSLRRSHIDLLLLDGVRDDSRLYALAAGRARSVWNRRVAPYADLRSAPTHDAFLRARGKNLARGIRQRRNQAEHAGRVEFEILEGGAAAGAAMDRALEMKRDWLVQRGAMSSAFLSDRTRKALRDLAEHCPTAIVMLMMLEGEAVALRFGFEFLGTYVAYLSTYSARVAGFSPGKLLMDFGFSQERRRGASIVDMLPPDGEHKHDWCAGQVGVADYPLPLNARGAVLATVDHAFQAARRWVWDQLPPTFRSALAARMLKI